MSDTRKELSTADAQGQEVGAASADGGLAVSQPARPRKRLMRRFVLLFVIPVLVIAGVGFGYALGGRYITTENAYVKSAKFAVSSDLDGRVSAVHVVENQRVRAGDVLVELDSRAHEIRLAETEADLARARSQVAGLKSDYRASLAELEETRARISHLESQTERYRSLSKRGIAASAQYEEAAADLSAAKRRVATQQERVKEALISIGGDINRPVEKHPLYLAAAAARDQALLWLDYTRIIAPANGIVTAIHLEPGEFVEKGEPIFALVDDRETWVEANLKETQLTHVHEGLKAEIEVDAYPGVTWKATVQGIAPATGAEFSILPPQNATGNWVKVVQRVPVRLRLLPNQDRPPLRAGMTAHISIDTGRERKLLTEARAAIGIPRTDR
ncbi:MULTISPECIES: HlyD family secretion protein [unclassified Minwuia]|uniref:HlyD family secretion protein n=1 Tax=unclassified Minwuia TaxID=2618799 RepID=UPI0024798748|nr:MULTISPECIES: HlyD family secretion protein [unclassified Minwuia]